MAITIDPNGPINPITVQLIKVEQNGNHIKCEWKCEDKESDTLFFSPTSESDKSFHMIFTYQGNTVTSVAKKSDLEDGATMDPMPVKITPWPPSDSNDFTSLPGGCLVITSGTSDDNDNLAFGYDGLILDPKIAIGGTRT